MRSHARLSRFGVSLCRTPNPRIEAKLGCLRRASDSTMAYKIIEDDIWGIHGETKGPG